MIHANDRKPAGIFPLVTIAVIVLNCLVLLYGLSLGPRFEAFVYRLGLIPYEVTRGRQVIFVRCHLVRDERTGDPQVMAEVSEGGFPDARSVLREAYFPIGMWFVGLVIHSIAGCSVAWFAHIGGFTVGFLLIIVLRPRKGLRRRMRHFVQ